jgi:hypothetical protein
MGCDGYTDWSSSALVRSIRIFLRYAYADATVPENRRQFLDLSEDLPVEELLGLKDVQELPPVDGEPGGYAFRIGNAWYPHMKLIVKPYADAPGYIFHVDTHDTFRLKADDPDAEGIRQLQRRNQELARKIEKAFEEAGLPTQAGMLRQYLLAAQGGPGPSR